MHARGEILLSGLCTREIENGDSSCSLYSGHATPRVFSPVRDAREVVAASLLSARASAREGERRLYCRIKHFYVECMIVGADCKCRSYVDYFSLIPGNKRENRFYYDVWLQKIEQTVFASANINHLGILIHLSS